MALIAAIFTELIIALQSFTKIWRTEFYPSWKKHSEKCFREKL